MTDDPHHKDGCPLGCDVCNDSRAVLDRIHAAIGKSAFGPKNAEEVAVFVEEYFDADRAYIAKLRKSVENANKKADDLRKAHDREKAEVARLRKHLGIR